jgi:hypothetical protein
VFNLSPNPVLDGVSAVQALLPLACVKGEGPARIRCVNEVCQFAGPKADFDEAARLLAAAPATVDRAGGIRLPANAS